MIKLYGIELDDTKLPQHIAIIMDGNGRWAQKRGLPRIYGHKAGAKTVRSIVETAAKLGIKCLSLFAFSTENWQRPKDEVEGLFALLRNYIKREEKNLVFFPKKLLILLFPLPYKEFIFEKAREKNIDPYLVYAIIRRESEFNEKAISPKGARGLMQILPETFKKIDKYKDFDSDSLFNPYINIDAGIEILSSLLDSIPEIYLAIASYNAGFYRIKEWKETGIIKDELQFFIDCPFEETRKYTFRVLSDYETYKKIYFE